MSLPSPTCNSNVLGSQKSPNVLRPESQVRLASDLHIDCKLRT